jgi:hypothetical protein
LWPSCKSTKVLPFVFQLPLRPDGTHPAQKAATPKGCGFCVF